jgi:HK97 family phage prohead protease
MPTHIAGVTEDLPTRKHLLVEVKDADKGLVQAVFSTFNVKDHDNDVTLPGAFEDGAKVRISAFGHASWMGALPVGKGVIRIDGDRAVLDGKFFMSTDHGRDTFATVKEMGDLQEWSFGFEVLETGEVTEELRQTGVWRVLKKLKVHEVSPVLVGAGIGTETLAVKAAAPIVLPEDPAIQQAAITELAHFERTRNRFLFH